MTEWNFTKIKEYIEGETWYQRIELSSGLTANGKVDSEKRLVFFKNLELRGKTVLDIGCNSGFYCLWAKKEGASKVVGIDIDHKRIAQARTLAEIEGLDISFETKGIFDLSRDGRFDIVFCFAVLTEIGDVMRALEVLKGCIKHKAFVEMALARPLLYLSTSLSWLKGLFDKRYSTDTLEVRPSKAGWMLSPSLSLVKNFFGEEFRVIRLGKGLRYDMVLIERVKNL